MRHRLLDRAIPIIPPRSSAAIIAPIQPIPPTRVGDRVPPVRAYRRKLDAAVTDVRQVRGGASPYDAIAELYDPWSRSVTEDVDVLRRRGAAGRGGPVVELGIGTGRIAIPIAQKGVQVIGVDSSREMLAACRRRAEDEGVAELLDLRLGDLRAPPLDAPVPLVICPFRSYLHLADDGERVEALTAARAALAPRRAPRLRRLRTEARRHRRDPRPLARARARHLRARRMGRERPHAHPLRPRPLGRRDDGPVLDLARGMAAAPRGDRLHRRGLLRLVRPECHIAAAKT